MKRIIYLLSILIIGFILTGCSVADLFADYDEPTPEATDAEHSIEEDGYYTSKNDVALYIHTFNKLPDNYITKSEANKLGWVASEGNLWEVTDQKSIGGDRFGNREGSLPDKTNRQYYEADIDYEGGYRGPERIVYSNDGLIYYTNDHYDTFTLLYGDE
ncbi:hypothetical protein JYK21_06520 [Ralstonia pickettii]|nr:hypothetical protein [Ralstonia pickettii]